MPDNMAVQAVGVFRCYNVPSEPFAPQGPARRTCVCIMQSAHVSGGKNLTPDDMAGPDGCDKQMVLLGHVLS